MLGMPNRTSLLARPLLRWFDRHKRSMPWRGTHDPYRVWVSEIMLQQTQVETVTRYYDAFLGRFPSVEALAAADEDRVLAAWSGLGFYRRARNLHKAARIVVETHSGVVPRDPKILGELPGLGRYTVGAILSIAHDDRLPILDGNVIRVLARVFRVTGLPGKGPAKRRLWSLAEAILPKARCGDFNQSLMELGALVCRPKSPSCGECPLRKLCASVAAGDPERFPEKAAKADVPAVERVAVYLEGADGHFLFEQRPPDGLLASMWELPGAEVPAGAVAEEVARGVARSRGARGKLRLRGTAEHRFSHRHWTIRVFGLTTRSRAARARGTWVSHGRLGRFGVPSVTRKTLDVARRERSS
jgi:A/G-specific adenine glycosylase